MAIIKDIRIYRSVVENCTGNPFPCGFHNMKLSCAVRRIVMKLKENGFALADFDHLYINLTTCDIESEISPAKREKDKLHPWFRYYDAHVSQSLYDQLETEQCIESVASIIELTLQTYFSTSGFGTEQIHECISEALIKGESMTMKFKEKTASKNKAVIYLRYLDNSRYFPLLKVWDMEDNLLLEADLPETNSLDAYGEIQLSSKKVTIKPRKNAFLNKSEPLTYIIP